MCIFCRMVFISACGFAKSFMLETQYFVCNYYYYNYDIKAICGIEFENILLFHQISKILNVRNFFQDQKYQWLRLRDQIAKHEPNIAKQ